MILKYSMKETSYDSLKQWYENNDLESKFIKEILRYTTK